MSIEVKELKAFQCPNCGSREPLDKRDQCTYCRTQFFVSGKVEVESPETEADSACRIQPSDYGYYDYDEKGTPSSPIANFITATVTVTVLGGFLLFLFCVMANAVVPNCSPTVEYTSHGWRPRIGCSVQIPLNKITLIDLTYDHNRLQR